MRRFLMAAGGLIALAQVVSAESLWKYRADVGTGGTDWAAWHDPENWTNGYIAAEGEDVSLTTAQNRYIDIAEPISVSKLTGKSGARPVLRSDCTNTLNYTVYQRNESQFHLYSPFTAVTKASGECYSGPSGVCFCGPQTGKTGGACPLLWGDNEFRLDRYALSADCVRTQTVWQWAMHMNNDTSVRFVAPQGSSEAIVANWSTTDRSPFLKRAAGQAEHVLSAGTVVTGEGIPDGTFLKRIFPDGTIELSQAATATAESAELAFAAFAPKTAVKVSELGAYNSTGSHTLYAEKYRDEDELTVTFNLTTYTPGAGSVNAKYAFSTHDGFVPGTFRLTGSDYGLLTLNDCHLELLDSLTLKHILVPTASKTARLTVGAEKTRLVNSIDQLVGTIVKDGTGTLSFALPAEGRTKLTGSLVVEEGGISVTGAADGGNYIANLTLKAGTTLTVPAAGLTVGTLVAEPGVKVAGTGALQYESASDETLGNLSLGEGAMVCKAGASERAFDITVRDGFFGTQTEGGDRIYVFPSNATLKIEGAGTIELLVVAGGGGGGADRGGGGGGGGVIWTNALAVNEGVYNVTVGLGGAGAENPQTKRTHGKNGGNSMAFGLTAIGGGGGTRSASDGGLDGWAGGSGGGGGANYYYNGGAVSKGGAGTEGQGFAGGCSTNEVVNRSHWLGAGGGGGGAGEPGRNAVIRGDSSTDPDGAGGDGRLVTIWGERYFGGGGGGGNGRSSQRIAPGGEGGGGNGGWSSSSTKIAGEDGEDCTGGGGGGGGAYVETASQYTPGGRGGSGVVIVRFSPAAKERPVADEDLAVGGVVRHRKGFAIHSFTEDGTFVLSQDTVVDLLLVGGGGGGGSSSGGGGGAGGLLLVTNALLKAGTYPITIGQGGAGSITAGKPCGGNGGETVFHQPWAAVNYAVPGGGGGGTRNSAGAAPGSAGASGGGGGAGYFYNCTTTYYPGGKGIVGFGHDGGNSTNLVGQASSVHGGGGGGAGAVGSAAKGDRGGNGGVGVCLDISGRDVWYAGGGGGGGAYSGTFCSQGGSGGGGRGGGCSKASGAYAGYPGEDGVDGTGGGGGGAGSFTDNTAVGGKGGCGCVIIRYAVKPHGAMLLIR